MCSLFSEFSLSLLPYYHALFLLCHRAFFCPGDSHCLDPFFARLERRLDPLDDDDDDAPAACCLTYLLPSICHHYPSMCHLDLPAAPCAHDCRRAANLSPSFIAAFHPPALISSSPRHAGPFWPWPPPNNAPPSRRIPLVPPSLPPSLAPFTPRGTAAPFIRTLDDDKLLPDLLAPPLSSPPPTLEPERARDMQCARNRRLHPLHQPRSAPSTSSPPSFHQPLCDHHFSPKHAFAEVHI